MKATLRFGVVLDGDQQPVAGALVAVEWGTGPTPEVALKTTANGRFQLALPQGRYRIRAHAPDGETGSLETRGLGDEDLTVILGKEAVLPDQGSDEETS